MKNLMVLLMFILLLAWTIAVSYYHGMRHGIEIGVDRSALVINCPNTFGVTNGK